MRGLLRRPFVLAAVMIGAVALAVGLWAFQPWILFTSSTLDEALPTVQSQHGQTPASQSAATEPNHSAASNIQPPAKLTVLAEGQFISQEHETTGLAKVLQLDDGSRVLRLESLHSSDGPDLHIWLTNQSAGGDWHKYDDGRFVRLGKLKATNGNQNYAIPAEIELRGLTSVVIWCDRFNVAFGSAPLSL